MSQFDQNHRRWPYAWLLKRGIMLMIILPVLLLSACSRAPDEQQIHEAIMQMRDAIESRQRKVVLQHLAADFKAQQSKSTQDINGLMLFYFRQNRNITVYLTNEQIKISGMRAEVTLNALLTGAENLIPQRARNYAVRMRWNKLDGEWQLSRVNWDVLPLIQN